MKDVIKIESKYANSLKFKVRDKYLSKDSLQNTLIDLGSIIAEEIIGRFYLTTSEIETPLASVIKGEMYLDSSPLIISTKDDYNYFGKGICSKFIHGYHSGFIDFQDLRGQEVLQKPIREITYRKKIEGRVDAVIIAKAVLATGCTAISLAKSAIHKFQPKRLIIATIFYSNEGIKEIYENFPFAQIVQIGDPDMINKDGILIPGVGILDQRLKI